MGKNRPSKSGSLGLQFPAGIKGKMAIDTARNLEEGCDYAPDWRHKTVNAYLEEVAASNDPLGHIQAVF